MKIFISYTTIDEEISEDFLLSIYNKLRLIGDVFIDILHNNSQNRQERVFEELEKSDLVILISTPSISKSEWVEKEVTRALTKCIPIINFYPPFNFQNLSAAIQKHSSKLIQI